MTKPNWIEAILQLACKVVHLPNSKKIYIGQNYIVDDMIFKVAGIYELENGDIAVILKEK